MGYLDKQFSEPHEWWGAYEERREAEYMALVKGKTCLDCGRCRRCEKHPDTGYCTEDGEFVYADDRPEETGCETFEAA